MNQIITTMAISYVLPIFFLMVVFVLHASAAEKPNRKVISSHIYPVYDSENQLQSLPDIADYFFTFCEGSYRLYGRSPNSWSWRLEGNRCYGSPWYAGIRSRKVNRHVLPNFLDWNDLEYFKLYFHVECMLYSIVLKNVIASHDVAEEALIYSYGTSFNGFAATLTSKSAKFPNSCVLFNSGI